ncbi:MAG: tryptophan synthase subunit alpha, partial [Chloroflexota bacterium]
MTESRIPAAFARARAEKRIAIVPFLTAGFPTLSESEEIFLALVRGGADLIEIGVPFSDPLADGATIQRSSEVAIANGVRLTDCIALVRSLRDKHGVTIPLILLGYYNP